MKGFDATSGRPGRGVLMFRATLKSLLAHKLRMGMSAFAIVLGRRVRRRHLRVHRHPEQQLHRPVPADRAGRHGPPGGLAAAACRWVHRRRHPGGAGRSGRRRWPALPGVARADGNITDQGTLSSARTARSSAAAAAPPASAATTTTAPAADGSPIVTITSGVAPTGPGQLVLDDKTAATAGYAARRHRRSWSPPAPSPSVTGTLVGTVRFGATGQPRRRHPGADGHRRPRNSCTWAGADAFNDIAVTGDGITVQPATPRRGHRRAAGRFRGRWTTQQIAAENQNQLQQALSVHHHLPAGVRRGRAGRRHLPDPEHVLDHRRPTHPGTRPVPGARRLPSAGHPLGAARGAGGRPGRVDGRPGCSVSAWPPG